MSDAWSGGSTRAWRKTRAFVLERDGYRCQVQREGCTTVATHAHHLDGKEFGDDPDRLVAACAYCNLAEGKPQGDPEPLRGIAW